MQLNPSGKQCPGPGLCLLPTRLPEVPTSCLELWAPLLRKSVPAPEWDNGGLPGPPLPQPLDEP